MSEPPVAATVAELRDLSRRLPRPLAFVPTMGALHDGHLALVDRARDCGGSVVVSVYVNPLQFGPNEDLIEYPRSLESDLRALAGRCDAVFAPTDAQIYPEPQEVALSLPAIAHELCGASRPGFFSGVATVVCKLLNMVSPDVAVFGKKDYQQLHTVRLIVRQLAIPAEIVAVETVREEDGLAKSSRNAYLGADERRRAPQLRRELLQIAGALAEGDADFAALTARAATRLTADGWAVDYVEIRAADLGPPVPEHGAALVALAAADLGKTRLIDNAEARFGDGAAR